MDQQRDSMRSERLAGLRVGLQDRSYDLHLIQHGGGKNIYSCPLRQEKFGDIFASHVGGGAQSCLPIAPAPVPGRIEERRLLLEQLFHSGKIPMRLSYKLL